MRSVGCTVAFLSLLAVGACAQDDTVRRFALRAPLWEDPDRNPLPRPPRKYESGLYADGLDESLLRPITEPLSFPTVGEAPNVNALDEVPDSSWFVNRIGRRPLSLEEAARGSCREADREALRPPLVVEGAKDEGATAGFFVRGRGAARFLVKLDPRDNQPERGSAADVIAGRIYHALGYHTPCNQVFFFRPRDLVIGEDAKVEDELGRRRPFDRARLRGMLASAYRLPDGRIRAVASLLVEGKPLGPRPARGVRADDPNDLIPHEHRRELRASRLIAAWLGRFDTREQNSLDVLVEEGGRRFVRHYELDFGDSFGGEWKNEQRLNERVGQAYYWDLGQIFTDLLSLGLVPRSFHHPRPRPGGKTFGYYGVQGFSPAEWKPLQPHPAFVRMTGRDALWIIRAMLELSEQHLRAMIREGRLSSPADERYLLRTLVARRDRIAAHYLLSRCPLAEVGLEAPSPSGARQQKLCFVDLSILHAGVRASQVRYRLRLLAGARLEQELGRAELAAAVEPRGRTCLELPLGSRRPAALAPRGAPDDHPLRYAVLEIAVVRSGGAGGTLRVHFYDRGEERGLVLVGLERL